MDTFQFTHWSSLEIEELQAIQDIVAKTVLQKQVQQFKEKFKDHDIGVAYDSFSKDYHLMTKRKKLSVWCPISAYSDYNLIREFCDNDVRQWKDFWNPEWKSTVPFFFIEEGTNTYLSDKEQKEVSKILSEAGFQMVDW